MDLAAGSVTFGSVQLKALRPSHVQVWVKRMQTRGLASSTIRTRSNNVRSVLRAAVADKVIASDPSEAIRLPRQRRAAVAMTIPTAEQVGSLIASADGPFRAFIGLAAFAWLRLGEAAAVQVGDIDFLRRTLAVSRQVQREGGGQIDIRLPKWGSERSVYLAPTLVDLLSEHVRQYVPESDGPRWLFVGDPPTQPPHQNTVGHRWRTTLTRAGLSGLTMHDLRHFYASGLIAHGCDVVTVQRALGHGSASTTLNTYAHLWPTAEDRTRAAAEAMALDAFGKETPKSRGLLAD